MAALTQAALRHVAHLYRAHVDGAAEELEAILRLRAAELPCVLGFPANYLERLHTHPSPVELLVRTIEEAPRAARTTRDRAHLEAATKLATRLAQTAKVRPDGHHVLEAALLAETLAVFPGRIVTFGELGSIGSGRLRAILRALRGVSDVTLVVTTGQVVIVYAGARMRGLIKLVLHEESDEHALVVPLELNQGRDRRATEQEAVRSLLTARASDPVDGSARVGLHPGALEAPGATKAPKPATDTPEGLLEPHGGARPRPAVRPFALRLVEALAAAMFGGAR